MQQLNCDNILTFINFPTKICVGGNLYTWALTNIVYRIKQYLKYIVNCICIKKIPTILPKIFFLPLSLKSFFEAKLELGILFKSICKYSLHYT